MQSDAKWIADTTTDEVLAYKPRRYVRPDEVPAAVAIEIASAINTGCEAVTFIIESPGRLRAVHVRRMEKTARETTLKL